MSDLSLMERIRRGVAKGKSGGGFPLLVIAIVVLVIIGMALRSF